MLSRNADYVKNALALNNNVINMFYRLVIYLHDRQSNGDMAFERSSVKWIVLL